MPLLVVWIALAFIPAYVASQKGRSPIAFFLLALVVSFLIALLVLIALPPGAPADGTGQAGTGMKCGKCGKPLSPVWRDKCAHCGARYAEFAPVPKT